MAVLASLHGSFTIALYGLYPLMFMTLGWWGMVPMVGLTALMGWALGGWGSGQSMVTNLLATAGLAALIAVFINAIGRQSEQRRDALAALAATRAELAEASRQAGVLAERERLARELHDTVAQGFISVVTQLESAEQALDGRHPGAADQARRAAARPPGETARGQPGRAAPVGPGVAAGPAGVGLAAPGADRAGPALVGGGRRSPRSCGRPATRCRCIRTPSWPCCGSPRRH